MLKNRYTEIVKKRVDLDLIASHQSTSIKEKGDDQVIHHDDQSSSEDDAPPNHAIVDPIDEIDIPLPRPWQFSNTHPSTSVIGNVEDGVKTRSTLQEEMNFAFTSLIEPRKVDEALLEVEWMKTMHEELEQFERNCVWSLVARLDHQNVIGTKWIFKNKLNEEGNVVRNKA